MKTGKTTLQNNETVAGYVITHQDDTKTYLRGASQKIAFLIAAKYEKQKNFKYCRVFVIRNRVYHECA